MSDTATAPAVATPRGIPLPIASRPQRRASANLTVSNANAGSFPVVQLPATGWVRRVELLFTQSITFASAAALVAGDGPFNLINSVTLTDATGQPVVQPISGYNLYLVNKFVPSGAPHNGPWPFWNPRMSPEFNYAVSGGTSGTAVFRLVIDFEVDEDTGYGCIPNLDSNASLQLRVDYAAASNAFTGTTPSAQSLNMIVTQEYWAPVNGEINGARVDTAPVGAGDYLETRFETQTVSAASENLVNLTNRGGLIRGILLVSRNAGVRTAYTAGSNVGWILDNQPINEGIRLEDHQNQVRRRSGYFGAENTTSYAPLTAGVFDGLDRGVIAQTWGYLSGSRDSWLVTRAGSLLQARVTPGAGATTLEVVTVMAQVKDPATFYGRN